MSPAHSRTKILLIGAVLGLVTTTLIWVYVARVRRAAGSLMETVVATEHIPARTSISASMFRVAKIPASDALPDMATKPEQLTDRVTLMPVEKGGPFSLSTITDKSVVYGLAAIIPRESGP